METHQGPCDSTDDGHVVPDQLDELQAESLVDAEGTSNGGEKRRFWKVQVRSSEGQDRERPMRVKDVNSLPTGEKVLIPFDGSQPSGTDADGLLGGFLGRLSQDHNIFPISFRRWPEVTEENYKDFAWNIIIKRNETGQAVSRGNLYIQTHKRIDGTFINDEARAICEKISEIESQENTPVEISPNDSLGQVFGKEHSGRVRGVGDGVSPSQMFGSPYQRFSTSSSSFNSVEHNRVTQLENQVQKLTKESEAKDEKMKRIEKLLAQLLANSSMHVPSDLDTSLDNTETPGGPSSRSDTNHP